MKIKTSSMILLAKTEIADKYLFGAYKNNGEATGFIKLPEDHKRFISKLTGIQTIMGANTLKATPADFPDGGRICITHHPDQIEKGAIPAPNIRSGIETAKKRAEIHHQKVVYVIGGASIIRQCIDLNLLDEIELTLTYGHQKDVPNPVYLDFHLDDWKITEDSGLLISKNSKPKNLKYRFLTLNRK